MRETKPFDYFLLTILAIIWASAFFNIKIATESFPALTIAFLRIFLGAIPVVLLCYVKKIKIEAFCKDWYWFAAIGFINLVVPFYLIAYGVKNVQSNLAAILMASTPLTAATLAHFFTKNEKINLVKTLGVLVGFSGIVFLFSDNILINKNNIFSAFLILFGSCFYVVGGLLTLKISNKENENVTASILIWGCLILLPISIAVDQSWKLVFPIFTPSLISSLSLLYLGVFSTGVAWLLRFYILKHNGLVFQAQVAYLIPIFGVILGYLILNEAITSKVIISMIAVIIGIYIVKRGSKIKIV
tara:strand:- start:95 stop:997 length:903 start_codon:yes stop_codon:yes gene_type:complete